MRSSSLLKPRIVLAAIYLVSALGFADFTSAANERELSINLGQAKSYLDNKLGGLMLNKYYGSSTVNSNRYQEQMRGELYISDLNLRVRSGSAAYQFRFIDTVSANETLAYDSIWSSTDQREFNSETVSTSKFNQWDIAYTDHYRWFHWGLGLKKSNIGFYNHDGVETYDLVPGFIVAQDGSVVDYTASYFFPYLSAIHPLAFYDGALNLDLQVNWIPTLSVKETETHYWRGYRATTIFTGRGYEFMLRSNLALDKRTRLNLSYESSHLSLQGERKFENTDIISIEQKQALRQWQILLGLSFLI